MSEEDPSLLQIATKSNDETVTFDQFKEKAWQISQPHLSEWKSRIDAVFHDRSGQVGGHLRDLSVLYGCPAPSEVKVSLQYYPEDGSQKGEPIDNFVDSGRLPRDFADVIYWISNPSILPSDTPQVVEDHYRQTTFRAVAQTLHETQHACFQSGNEVYSKLVKESENDPVVAEILAKLGSIRGDYIDVTAELITTYLEKYGYQTLLSDPKPNLENFDNPIDIIVDQEKSNQIIEQIIRQDIENDHSHGPYTRLRQAWETEIGSSPNGYQAVTEPKGEDKAEKPNNNFMGIKIYEIARSLETDLAAEYVSQSKQMDVDFVRKLYQLVESKLEKQ